MININSIDNLKAMSELQADVIPGGVIYLIIEGDTITWRKASKAFDLDIFQVGDKISSTSIAAKAMKENRAVVQNIPRSMYGMRLSTVAEPLVNDEGQPVGAYSMLFPRLHPVFKSFGDYAPIVADMFPEGAFLYATDLQSIIERQPSKKYDMTDKPIGYKLKETDIAYKVIQSKKHITAEVDKSVYGVPVLVTSYPMFDEENATEVVGTLGVVIPKALAGNLTEMSNNLGTGLSGIASAIEELAASASNIHANEQELNNEIKEITKLSEEINEVSSFIKAIADETKMLGLNAAIEAARAGEAGRGFGVVAQEIRNLSEQSKGTVPKIKELTDRIKAKVEETSLKSQESLSSSQEQAAATEEITASIEEITSMSIELNKIANEL
ncbi:MAG: methyl-accepting chemotaxis protein [Solirubrobacterales bacterium]